MACKGRLSAKLMAVTLLRIPGATGCIGRISAPEMSYASRLHGPDPRSGPIIIPSKTSSWAEPPPTCTHTWALLKLSSHLTACSRHCPLLYFSKEKQDSLL